MKQNRPVNNRKTEKKQNHRIFRRLKNGNPGKYVFDKTTAYNKADISGAAALAMHKAIIGICEMESLESAAKTSIYSFRPALAIQVYYVVYHIFTCCMLLDSQYDICFYPNQKGEVSYGVNITDLRRLPDLPEDWNKRKFKEIDLATKITHSEIKNYCKNKREENEREVKIPSNSFIMKLYGYFIDNRCSCILYEKLAYIRDRCIYRPSHVASSTNVPIQTSKNVRNQIDSLPTSSSLYGALRDIHLQICDNASKEDPNDLLCWYGTAFFNSSVNCDTEYALGLGYTWEDLEKMGGTRSEKSVPSFLCHLMEYESPEAALYFYQKYWKELNKDTIKKLS